ncbi:MULTISPECIES: TetR/AcrR family transcriptional regulator [Bacillus cereus group]|uniref:TetR/AcrR family transcriptional regulator n=1 Tax=Bacillus cereus group TaxID=86661 RepID=UPI000447D88E|nr:MULTISPECIES: TetR family transcriptional regulator [Bacillus cereus group]HDR7797859.1 TetR family transcriptional regulator [Bacillus tropicus]EXY05685.1 TetR family transcriptional regulator [Bacillus thuringiensis]MDA1925707.1 TetR family transcriptional regulator [Bacillus cereus]MEB8632520.1 TetR family transcriptional regulator [Bacillus cereus]MEB8745923.1 TetR family transcriptional regulator [Bacillus cereus]
MPKQTFFNLEREKKEVLIQAAMKEFSRVPLFEASISNIIKDAGIPRGSFYQYFEDKEDVFFFLLNNHSKRDNDKFISIIKENEGDLFDSYIELYQYLLKKFQNLENRNFFRNAFLNMNYKVENTFTRNMNEAEHKDRLSEIMPLINKEKLNIADEREIFHVMKIITAVTFHNLIQNFAKEIPFDESVESYTLELSLLKKGLYKSADK